MPSGRVAWPHGYEHEPQRHCDIAVDCKHRVTLIFSSTLWFANGFCGYSCCPMILLAQASEEQTLAIRRDDVWQKK